MKKYPLIGGSIIAVVLLVLSSLTNVVGYQTSQSSNQNPVNVEVNQKEMLFQTILDIANNKEVQKTILNSEVRREGFFYSLVRFSPSAPQVLKKDSLNRMYFVGLMFSKIISKSRMHSFLERHQVLNQEIQNKINTVVEEDATLKGKMTQLSNMKCDCGNDSTVTWNFPVVCTLLTPIVLFLWVMVYWPWIIFNVQLHFFIYLYDIIGNIGSTLNCYWA
jgi:hypothetical protein